MIELEEVTKVYQRGRRTVEALRGVSVRITPGEFVVIMGRSGSGKSTLLHLLGALDSPTSGRALFEGRDLGQMPDRERARLRRGRIGFVFQFFNLLPTLTALENVSLPLLLAGRGRKEVRTRALAALEQAQLEDRSDHYPDELSGGEMQRVAIARALVSEPAVVLCDEPTGNLDSATSQGILAVLRGLPEPDRRAVVMVTHDPQAAAQGDRVIRLHDGRIEMEESLRGRHAVAVPNP